jgi:hypothetical protein
MKTILMPRKGTTETPSANVNIELEPPKMVVHVHSDDAFDQLSQFINGAGTVFDISGSYLSYPSFGSLEQDGSAVKNDFSVIAEDFRQILNANRSYFKAYK